MKVLVLVDLSEEHVRKLQAVSDRVELILGRHRIGDETVKTQHRKEVLADVEVIVGGFNRELFFACPKLKWVQVWSAGVDGLLFPEFVESDVILTSAKGWVGQHLADHAFALLLALTRGIATAVRSKSWDVKWDIRGGAWELTDKTMGIVGFGGTGQEVAKRAVGFGMRIIAVDPEDVPKPDYVEAIWKFQPPPNLSDPSDPFRRLLEQSDAVCICAPLTPETEGMFNLEAFKCMKRHALLINVTRGRIMDEESLVTALREGLIGGAGLDVTPQEPLPKDHPLWDMPNVVITPHVAGASQLRTERAVELTCENLRRFLAGEPLLSVIDKRKGY